MLLGQLVYLIEEKLDPAVVINFEDIIGKKLRVTAMLDDDKYMLSGFTTAFKRDQFRLVTTVQPGDMVQIIKPPQETTGLQPGWSGYMNKYIGTKQKVETVEVFYEGYNKREKRVEICTECGYYFRDEWFRTLDKRYVTLNGRRSPVALDYDDAVELAERIGGEVEEV